MKGKRAFGIAAAFRAIVMLPVAGRNAVCREAIAARAAEQPDARGVFRGRLDAHDGIGKALAAGQFPFDEVGRRQDILPQIS